MSGQFAPIVNDGIPGPCPECLQGKHGNCDGTTWDIVKDDLAPCPCQQNNHGHGGVTVLGQIGEHVEEIGTAVLGEMPECNGRCYSDVEYADIDKDCPVHGGPEREVCPECGQLSEIADSFDDQIGYEERARPVHVTALVCGHDIVHDTKGRTL